MPGTHLVKWLKVISGNSDALRYALTHRHTEELGNILQYSPGLVDNDIEMKPWGYPLKKMKKFGSIWVSLGTKCV